MPPYAPDIGRSAVQSVRLDLGLLLYKLCFCSMLSLLLGEPLNAIMQSRCAGYV